MFSRLFESPSHVLILVILVVVIFGWKHLPDMARSVGRSTRILKSEVDEMKRESQEHTPTESGATKVETITPAETSEPMEGPIKPPTAL